MVFVDAQASVTVPPGCTAEALELNSMAGVPSEFVGGSLVPVGSLLGCETLIEALRVMLPPDPVQVSVYVAFDVGCTPWLPLTGLLPPQDPDAEHDVALLLDQFSVEP